jgi:hypothetical protein
LLTQPRFIQRQGALAVIFHGYVFDHILDADRTRRPPPLAECLFAG